MVDEKWLVPGARIESDASVFGTARSAIIPIHEHDTPRVPFVTRFIRRLTRWRSLSDDIELGEGDSAEGILLLCRWWITDPPVWRAEIGYLDDEVGEFKIAAPLADTSNEVRVDVVAWLPIPLLPDEIG